MKKLQVVTENDNFAFISKYSPIFSSNGCLYFLFKSRSPLMLSKKTFLSLQFHVFKILLLKKMRTFGVGSAPDPPSN